MNPFIKLEEVNFFRPNDPGLRTYEKQLNVTNQRIVIHCLNIQFTKTNRTINETLSTFYHGKLRICAGPVIISDYSLSFLFQYNQTLHVNNNIVSIKLIPIELKNICLAQSPIKISLTINATEIINATFDIFTADILPMHYSTLLNTQHNEICDTVMNILAITHDPVKTKFISIKNFFVKGFFIECKIINITNIDVVFNNILIFSYNVNKIPLYCKRISDHLIYLPLNPNFLDHKTGPIFNNYEDIAITITHSNMHKNSVKLYALRSQLITYANGLLIINQ